MPRSTYKFIDFFNDWLRFACTDNHFKPIVDQQKRVEWMLNEGFRGAVGYASDCIAMQYWGSNIPIADYETLEPLNDFEKLSFSSWLDTYTDQLAMIRIAYYGGITHSKGGINDAYYPEMDFIEVCGGDIGNKVVNVRNYIKKELGHLLDSFQLLEE